MGGNDLFSNQELKKMIVPLFLEQLLVMFVGLADTLVISYAGESAVSGVSLVNQFNTIFIYLFTALASGGAVVISQYIGRQDTDLAGESASQLLMFSFGFSVLFGAAVLLGNEAMLCLLFGKVEQPVRRLLTKRGIRQQYIYFCTLTVTREDVRAFMAERPEYTKANRFKDIVVKVYI